MKTRLILIAGLFIVSCFDIAAFSQVEDLRIELGSKVPEKLAVGVRRYIFTHTNQTRPYVVAKVDKIKYTIAFDREDREIIYLNTNDKNFRTQNGLKVGDRIEIRKEDFYVIWQLEIRGPAAPDGWEPVVGYDTEGIERKPNFVDRLQPNETVRVQILSFSKGEN